MLALHQFDYIFAIGVMFAFLDAFNIGANDVANSFSSSVASRCLKYWQAMLLAAIMEFLGAVLVGSRVSDTIRTKIIDLNAFNGSPAGLMITMMCALIGSSVWLTIATFIGMPVSTTHSITGGIIGSGIAAVGAENVFWGWKGFSQIVASWFIAPVLGGCISGCLFLIVKFGVLERKHNLRNALILAPIIVFLTFSVLTMLIVWKGSPQLKLDDLSTGATVGSILGVGAVASILYLIFINPIFVRRLMYDDWTIPFYHVPIGFMYYFKSKDDIPPLPEGKTVVTDYYSGKGAETQPVASSSGADSLDSENASGELTEKKETFDENEIEKQVTKPAPVKEEVTADNITITTTATHGEKKIWLELAKRPAKWPLLIGLLLSYGVRFDVIDAQIHDGSRLARGVEGMHARSKHYNIKVEHIFSMLQAVTACTILDF
ncbi:unnamed protein product [Ambrosiozyma monospora]|uniref:Unnamed protein product n=1 Tax=Ambrosiozyma monospora TaxID=43982 RepID=A0ACB5SVW2_AMBMO|nr:unnamed protein product [Ambrosiozyma monospora]